MATDFGLDNDFSSPGRYFEFPNNPQWSFLDPNNVPHTLASMIQIVDASGPDYGYYHSTGPWGDANVFNFYHGENSGSDAGDLQARFGTRSAINREVIDGTIDDGQWRIHYYREPAGTGQQTGYINIDGTAVRQAPGSNTLGDFSPNRVLFGTRADPNLNNNRWYKNRLAWFGMWVNYSLTDQDLIDLANGTITPFELQNASLQVLADFEDHNTARDLISGDTPTKFGAGWANVSQPYPAAPSQPFTGYVSHSII